MTIQRLLLFCGLLATVLLVAGCGGATTTSASVALPTAVPAPTAERTAEQRIERGVMVYNKHYCGACHQLPNSESVAVFGPTFTGVASTAEQRISDPNYAGTATTAEGYLRESILAPKAYVVSEFKGTNMPMPIFKLTESELNDLVQMLLLQK